MLAIVYKRSGGTCLRKCEIRQDGNVANYLKSQYFSERRTKIQRRTTLFFCRGRPTRKMGGSQKRFSRSPSDTGLYAFTGLPTVFYASEIVRFSRRGNLRVGAPPLFWFLNKSAPGNDSLCWLSKSDTNKTPPFSRFRKVEMISFFIYVRIGLPSIPCVTSEWGRWHQA